MLPASYFLNELSKTTWWTKQDPVPYKKRLGKRTAKDKENYKQAIIEALEFFCLPEDVAQAIGKSRSYTARVMCEMYEDGLIDREQTKKKGTMVSYNYKLKA